MLQLPRQKYDCLSFLFSEGDRQRGLLGETGTHIFTVNGERLEAKMILQLVGVVLLQVSEHEDDDGLDDDVHDED